MVISKEELQDHVRRLAVEIGERHIQLPAKLHEAGDYIRQTWVEQGYEVILYPYLAKGVESVNYEISLPGVENPKEIILIGAHYDSVPGCPAANDNGSGVAALLALSRGMRTVTPAVTVRFVAFVNEEPPFFQTEEMGSLVHARASRARGDDIVAMISLETIGYYRDEESSQAYPPPFNLFYPDVGNFLGFVGNFSSRALVRDCIRVFRETTLFPSEGGAPPGQIPGIGWSDHWAFWQEGYRALMVTDTAPFRYPHYHTREDTPDKVDYERMARVAAGLTRVVIHLASRTQ